jgi:NAD(P)-dependent dehydrogenase (short-subunit alcohol dehydrogenase family)
MTTAGGHVVVVGGYGAVGSAVATDLQQSGYSVITVSRRKAGVRHVAGDIRDHRTHNTILSMGPIRGVVFAQRYRNTDDWASQIDSMLIGPVQLIELLIHSKMLCCGSVLFISSNAAHYAVTRVALSYTATRGAINSLVRQLAYQYSPQRVRFNTVSFTTILKPNPEGSFEVDPLVKQRFQRIAKIAPNGRLATTVDVAGVVNFLLSDRGEMINGQEIVVDGGLSILSAETAIEEVSK